MKHLITPFLTLFFLLISCKKDAFTPNNENNHDFVVLEAFDQQYSLDFTNIHVIDTFYGSKCDTFDVSPVMLSMGIFWGEGSETTIGLFSWEINSLIVCSDGPVFNSGEVYLYKHWGEGEIVDFDYEIIYPSSEMIIDTVSLSNIYGESYSNDDNSVIRFYSATGRPFNLKIKSITVENNAEN